MGRKSMKNITIFIVLLVLLFGFTQRVAAQEIEYLGKYSDRDVGLIRMENIDYEVFPGVEIPGWGTVQQITDSFLVVDILLSEVDKEILRLQEAVVYDKIQLHIPTRRIGIAPVYRP
jgi:hypothetical protein